ncbi:MAG: response regulator transcription factor [Alteraurantiacibacter sp.]
MDRITILTTDAEGAHYADFQNGEAVFRFAELAPEGPRSLVDGQSWMFVDWVMESLSGLEMVRRLRADTRMDDAHITMVLEEDEAEYRRRALKAGADDYAVGPLNRQAMLDRVLALCAQRHQSGIPQSLQFGNLQINVAGEQARWHGELIGLRPNEFRVLRFMVENPNRVLSRKELINALGKDGDPEYLRTVDVWIKRLRQGLRDAGAEQLLRTVHGRGYVLDLI